MKRFVTLMMSLLLTAGLLTACGGQKDEGGAEDAQVSLNSLYAAGRRSITGARMPPPAARTICC